MGKKKLDPTLTTGHEIKKNQARAAQMQEQEAARIQAMKDNHATDFARVASTIADDPRSRLTPIVENGETLAYVAQGQGTYNFQQDRATARIIKKAQFIETDVTLRLLHEAIETIGLREAAKSHGCTLVVVMVVNSEILIAHVGDSRAVLYSSDGAQCLTWDHKPNQPDERRRLRAARATVRNNRVLGTVPDLPNRGQHNSSIGMSRSIGNDSHFLGKTHEPSFNRIPMPDGPCKIILATDGIWDVCDANDITNLFSNDELSIAQKANQLRMMAHKRARYLQRATTTPRIDNHTALVASPRPNTAYLAADGHGARDDVVNQICDGGYDIHNDKPIPSLLDVFEQLVEEYLLSLEAKNSETTTSSHTLPLETDDSPSIPAAQPYPSLSPLDDDDDDNPAYASTSQKSRKQKRQARQPRVREAKQLEKRKQGSPHKTDRTDLNAERRKRRPVKTHSALTYKQFAEFDSKTTLFVNLSQPNPTLPSSQPNSGMSSSPPNTLRCSAEFSLSQPEEEPATPNPVC